jgi:outer membrane protein assembly factor BamB
MGGGDGWIYSFDPAGDGKGGAKLLWKFDGNPKESIYLLSGRSSRNHIIGTPVYYDGKVYAGVGEDPEHGEGNGHYYCIDPTKQGDVSLELAIGADGKELAPRRIQCVDPKKGEKAIPNPNSAAVWHYDGFDRNKNGKIDFEETMHRTIGSAAIKDDLLYVSDIAGLVHCIDAKKSVDGKPVVYWTHDMFAAAWGSVLIVDKKVYVGDEDGDISIFELSPKLNVLAENSMVNSVYSTPIVANNTLYISNKSTLFAIKEGAKLEGGVKQGNAQGSAE